MDLTLLAIGLFVVLIILLSFGTWIAFALLAVGWLATNMFVPTPAGGVMALTVWGASGSWTLVSLPLFILMGEILFRSRMSEQMFHGLAPFLNWIPGRLMHVNILGCGIMAAVVGSSSVTSATIGRISFPELARRGYNEKMSIGTLAGSGTLGLLIPPSIMLIVYGVVSQTSIARLFMAGILPGLMLVFLFMAFVVVWSLWNRAEEEPEGVELSLLQRVSRARHLIPVMFLILGVLGSIYGGWATPTEAAAIGVTGSLILAMFSGTLNWTTFRAAVMAATRTACMITIIIAAAAFLGVALDFAGIPEALARWISSLELSLFALVAVLTVFYILLGCFLDGVSMIVLTASIVIPMVEAVGIDLVWFGIYLIIVIEMAQITPPVGFNLFVLQSITGRDMLTVTLATAPFFFLMILGIVLITLYPQIVLVLPETVFAR